MKQKKTLLKVLRLLRPRFPLLILALVLTAASVLLSLYIPILTGDAVDLLLGAGQVNFSALFSVLKIILLCFVLSSLFQWITSLCNNRAAFLTVQELRNRAFEHLQELPLSALDRTPVGDRVSRMIADVDQFSDGLLMGFSQLFSGLITIVATLVFMLTVNVPVTLVVALVTPVSLLVARFIAQRTHAMFKDQTKIRGEQTSLIDEMVGQQKIVQAFGQEEKILSRFDEINRRLKACSLRAIFFSSITNPATRFVNSLVYSGVGIAGALSAIAGMLSIGQLSCFLSYANQYTKPFNEISGVIAELQSALACAERIFELIESPSQEPDAPQARELSDVSGHVSIEDICFSYTPKQKLIENFSFQAKPGQRIAIVGPTGCGKTTIINLLMRFYDVHQGQICVDDHPVNLLTRSSLRRSYGMVLQETWLRKGTVRENIAMGRPDATEEEIIAAAKAAHAHSFIRRLPQGYDTQMGEGGGSLSQGQKQLLCIARVMLCLPPMLILDEATSSIDTRTEQQIQLAFSSMMQGRTSFIVAHRLSTIRQADQILVMREGRIVEQGTHRSLLEQNGFYAQLYRSQFEGMSSHA